ncbi:cartilage acidic protein 1-like [Mercenaria mercenaria]|uniref:cartilage acidic protein 1-like n=1 Tax=Mercenaria mercenaria TaxID=6596 RepID=UPI00234FA30D|nr:cartilage acidic protein 1-like [Mercenaria mercenaria]
MERDGRGILVGPILSNEYSSNIFITNDNSYHTGSYVTRHDGRNVLLKNNGDGTFQDVATELGVADRNYNGRGSGMLDFNADSKLDIALTNWLGPSRMFQQQDDNNRMQFQETEESLFSHSTASAALLTCDFDNDGQADILKSGANGDINWPKYNGIFTIISRKKSTDEKIKKTELADDENFKRLRIRGMAVADLNGDGILELFTNVNHRPFRKDEGTENSENALQSTNKRTNENYMDPHLNSYNKQIR